MEIHYLIILADAIVDADEDKKRDKNGTLQSIIFCAFLNLKNNITNILQIR